MIQLYRPFCSSLRVVSTSFPFPVGPTRLSFPPSRKFSGEASEQSLGQSTSCRLEAARLKSRSLIKLQGPDTLPLLQGLITNDVTHFENRPSIYALFLNHQGRVLWETLLYHVVRKEVGDESKEVFVECDSSIKSNIIKHLKTFKLRKKVDIVDLEEGESALDLWAVFDHGHTTLAKKQSQEECCGPVVAPSSKRPDFPVNIDPSILSFGDPRLNELGWRIFVPRSQSGSFLSKDVSIVDETSYKRLRYALGVAEGVTELPSASCFPLESNGDYLHGVSFQKGCYIGQELTARTHHTGVVRKRVMPFRIPEGANLENVDPSGLQLVNATTGTGKSLGKIRGICGSHGIGLIRIDEALSAPQLKIQDVPIDLEKPYWWPKEASKEKQTRQ